MLRFAVQAATLSVGLLAGGRLNRSPTPTSTDMGRQSQRKRARRGGRSGASNDGSNAKLSARLVLMITPYRTNDMDLDDVRSLIAVAATGWNLALFPERDREEALGRALASLPLEAGLSTRHLVLEMAARKMTLFPDDDRFVAHQKVIEERGHFRVLAGSLSSAGDER